MAADISIVEITLQLVAFWFVGFIVALLLVLPFFGVKNVLDVASAASGEIRGA